MSVPAALTVSAIRAGAIRSGPPPGWPNTAPVVPSPPSANGNANSRRLRTRSTARSRSGSNATTVADRRRPSFVSTSVRGSPATTWALVTTRLAPATNPLPAWIWSQAWPWILSTDAETRAATSGATALVGGAPTPPGLGRRVGRVPVDRADDRRVPRRTRRPALRARQRRREQPHRDEHAEHPDDRPADAIAVVEPLA